MVIRQGDSIHNTHRGCWSDQEPHQVLAGAPLLFTAFVKAIAVCMAPCCMCHDRPRSLDDSLARADWGWKPRYDLAAMTKDMISKLEQQQGTKAGSSTKAGLGVKSKWVLA
jgi:hypothetical protein